MQSNETEDEALQVLDEVIKYPQTLLVPEGRKKERGREGEGEGEGGRGREGEGEGEGVRGKGGGREIVKTLVAPLLLWLEG